MTAFTPLQLGDQIPGFVGAIATGSTQADAVPITSKLTIFTSVPSGSGCVLPSTGASHIAVQIINNGANSLSVYPAGNGQIDALGASQPYSIPASGAAEFHCQDPVIGAGRQWYSSATGGNVSSLSVTGNASIGGSLTLSADPTTALQAATKQYADLMLPKAGGTLTGALGVNTLTTSGTNQSLSVSTTGTGTFNLSNGNGILAIVGQNGTGSVVNRLFFNGGQAGGAPSIAVGGPSSDSNLNLTITTKGTGGITFNGGSGGLTLSTGPANFRNAVAYAGTQAASNALWWANTAYSGTAADTGNFNFNLAQITDNVALTTNTTANNFGWVVRTDAGMTGQRGAGVFQIIQQAQSGNAAIGRNYLATTLQSFFFASHPEGGSDTTPNGSLGAAWGLNTVSELQSGATNWRSIIGYELNVDVQTGATVSKKTGFSIVKTSNDAVQGSSQDRAMVIADQVNTSVGWLNGVVFGDQLAQWAIDPSGKLITALLSSNYATKPSNAAWGIDFLQPTFSGGFLRSQGFSVDGSGAIQVGTALVKSISGGASIDVAGSVGTGVPTISSGGSGYANNDLLFDSYGGIYKVASVSSGAVATVTVYRQPTLNSTTTPSNPVPTTTWVNGSGTGCTLTLSWDTSSVGLSLNPTGAKIGFNGSSPVTKPTVTGSRGGNAALASLLTSLASYGLITDSTTA